jgi:hypothetical protein
VEVTKERERTKTRDGGGPAADVGTNDWENDQAPDADNIALASDSFGDGQRHTLTGISASDRAQMREKRDWDPLNQRDALTASLASGFGDFGRKIERQSCDGMI